MPVLQDIRQSIERFMLTPGKELGRGARFARFQVQLWRFCARRLLENNVGAMSAALSFRTIFALIPTIVLAVLIMTSLGLLNDSKESLRRFLDASGFAQIAVVGEAEGDSQEATTAPAADSGVAGTDSQAAQDQSGSMDSESASSEEPDQVINVAEKIEELVAVVEGKMTLQRIGPIGVALLIWTALSLLTQLERSLNRIFGASRARPLARRLLLYWSALTLGPVILAAASVAGSKAATAFENMPGVSWILWLAGWAGPTLVGILVVATFYKLLPNTDVRYRAAVGGALVSVPLWLLAKAGFAFYVTRLVGTGNLYGALGLLPLFLVWLNLSWLIFLFGAQLAQTAANLGRIQISERSQRIALGPADLLAAAIAVARPFVAGRGTASVEQIADQLQLPADAVQRLLDRLSTARVVCRVESDQTEAYVLARPAEKIPVIEVFGVHRGAGSDSGRAFHGDIASLVTHAELRTRDELGGFTLADVIAGDLDGSERGGDAPV